MSIKLKDWLSCLPSISTNSREALIRYVQEYEWDMLEFDEGFIRGSIPEVLRRVLSPFDIGVVHQMWKSDFELSGWRSALEFDSPVRKRKPKEIDSESRWSNHLDLCRSMRSSLQYLGQAGEENQLLEETQKDRLTQVDDVGGVLALANIELVKLSGALSTRQANEIRSLRSSLQELKAEEEQVAQMEYCKTEERHLRQELLQMRIQIIDNKIAIEAGSESEMQFRAEHAVAEELLQKSLIKSEARQTQLRSERAQCQSLERKLQASQAIIQALCDEIVSVPPFDEKRLELGCRLVYHIEVELLKSQLRERCEELGNVRAELAASVESSNDTVKTEKETCHELSEDLATLQEELEKVRSIPDDEHVAVLKAELARLQAAEGEERRRTTTMKKELQEVRSVAAENEHVATIRRAELERLQAASDKESQGRRIADAEIIETLMQKDTEIIETLLQETLLRKDTEMQTESNQARRKKPSIDTSFTCDAKEEDEEASSPSQRQSQVSPVNIAHKLLQATLSGEIASPAMVIEKLKEIDDRFCKLETKYENEVDALRKKYQALQAPLLEERLQALTHTTDTEESLRALIHTGAKTVESGTPACPEFWLQAFQNSQVADVIEKWDEDVLKYLKNVQTTDLGGNPRRGSRLEFLFAENPYFSNDKLWVEFHTDYDKTTYKPYNDLECIEVKSSRIDWKASKNKGGGNRRAKQKAKATEAPRESFFRFFFRNLRRGNPLPQEDPTLEGADAGEELEKNDSVDALLSLMDSFTRCFKDLVIPYAVRMYTGDIDVGSQRGKSKTKKKPVEDVGKSEVGEETKAGKKTDECKQQ